MARALSPAEFLDALDKSKLLGPVAVEPYRAALDRYPCADDLADALTAEGLLTKFQAEHLRQGKWQGFFLGTYKMLDRLGTGSTSVVYLAEHVRLKQQVAIKVLSPQKAQDAEALGRFEREAKAAAAVRHPHVVHAFDVATEGRVHYMVMEYVAGRTLLKALADTGRMAPRPAARMLHQVAQGLHAAHQSGIVHRDVKPSNVMIAADGAAKIMDLGLARYEADETALTQGKAVLGLVAYTAPEQMRENAVVDARTDVYALGATLYLAAAGKRPPVVGTAPPSVPARTPAEEGDYRKLMGVIERMMAVQPEDRYQSMADVAAAVSISGLLAETKARSKAAPVATPEPESARTVSRPAARPAAAPLPDFQNDAFVVAFADESPPAHDTPLPAWNQSAPDLMDVKPDSSFKIRVQGLFDSLGSFDIGPEPEVELLSDPPPPDREPLRQYIAAGVTFALVLALLFLLAR